jgi:hypothetical protein
MSGPARARRRAKAKQLVAQMQVRVIQDALAAGLASTWLRRAEDFHRVGTPACDEIAQACRNRASLAEFSEADALDALRGLLYDLLQAVA